jgi:hypothetical protein
MQHCSKPCHGILNLSDDNVLYFYPGKSKDDIIIPDLSANVMICLKQLNFSRVVLNSRQCMMLEISFIFDTVYFIMVLHMVGNL